MKAKEIQLLKFLQGEKQFKVPLYQRTYSWKIAQCEQYWNDLVRAGSSPQVGTHFLGAVVNISHGVNAASEVSQYLVIDGQQRLTTTTLLLAALTRHLAQSGELILRNENEEGDITETRITAPRLKENHLINHHEDGDGRYKLVLTQSDREILFQLIEGEKVPQAPQGHLLQNYHYFAGKLGEPGVQLENIYRGLQKLLVVDVSLEPGRDNPQLIFESMNSTGLDLTQADLIRNFVLMGLEPKAQNKLYKEHWFPMESLFREGDPQKFDYFVRDYLSVKSENKVPVRLEDVYVSFKRYLQDQQEGLQGQGPMEVPEVLRDLHEWAHHYAAITQPEKHVTEPRIKEALINIKTLKFDVWAPLGMYVYGAWKREEIQTADLLQVLTFVESYLFRRWVTGQGAQSLNKFFPSLPAQIEQQNFVASLQDLFFSQRGVLRFPTDPEFQQALQTHDFYKKINLCRYTLARFENHGHKEKIIPENYTIEHIMPQNEKLSAEWQDMLGDNWQQVQDRYLHTLGNLTLTGYNSELSDRPFLVKKDMAGGFKDSHLRLNHDLAELTEWNEDQIQARAQRLAEQAIHIWPAVQPSPELLKALESRQKERSERSVQDHLQGASPALHALFEEVQDLLLGLHPKVQEVPTGVYIAYKAGSNFCDVVPLTSSDTLKLWLNLPASKLADPKGWGRDVGDLGHHGNGDIEILLTSDSDLEYFTDLAQQALNWQLNHKASATEAASKQALLEQASSTERALLEAILVRLEDLSDAKVRYNKRSVTSPGLQIELTHQDRLRVYADLSKEDIDELGLTSHFEIKKTTTSYVYTPSDIELLWPAYERAIENRQQKVPESKVLKAKAFYQGLIERIRGLGPDIHIEETLKSAKVFRKETEFARIYTSFYRGGVGIRMNVPFGTLDDPHGLGKRVPESDSTKGFVKDHYDTSFNSPQEVDMAMHLVEQVYLKG